MAAPLGHNAWPNWEPAVLTAAGLPVTPANETFLANWHQYELSKADFNPLNTTAYAPIPATVGTGSINSAGVQSYASEEKGAAATAAYLKMSNYTALYDALKSGDPYNYATKSRSNASAIGSALAKWGSRNFALRFLYEQTGLPAPAAGDTVTQANRNPETGQDTTTTTKGPTDIVGWLTGWWGGLTAKLGYAVTYFALVAFAIVLALLGLLKLLGVSPSSVARNGATAAVVAA